MHLTSSELCNTVRRLKDDLDWILYYLEYEDVIMLRENRNSFVKDSDECTRLFAQMSKNDVYEKYKR